MIPEVYRFSAEGSVLLADPLDRSLPRDGLALYASVQLRRVEVVSDRVQFGSSEDGYVFYHRPLLVQQQHGAGASMAWFQWLLGTDPERFAPKDRLGHWVHLAAAHRRPAVNGPDEEAGRASAGYADSSAFVNGPRRPAGEYDALDRLMAQALPAAGRRVFARFDRPNCFYGQPQREDFAPALRLAVSEPSWSREELCRRYLAEPEVAEVRRRLLSDERFKVWGRDARGVPLPREVPRGEARERLVNLLFIDAFHLALGGPWSEADYPPGSPLVDYALRIFNDLAYNTLRRAEEAGR